MDGPPREAGRQYSRSKRQSQPEVAGNERSGRRERPAGRRAVRDAAGAGPGTTPARSCAVAGGAPATPIAKAAHVAGAAAGGTRPAAARLAEGRHHLAGRKAARPAERGPRRRGPRLLWLL